ncbi:hypothetical protein SCHPADRAFT_1001052 [Schizopora paradoxa]|uniref:Uncharacterized protein n=1 Tax=Schizopora paradoxa TaxID=27342 RepID=A0A0H2RFI3_9AGAM|nr:hypothetical protein SCHPADRAFT_1001052 [Schizopora paradoxa]
MMVVGVKDASTWTSNDASWSQTSTKQPSSLERRASEYTILVDCDQFKGDHLKFANTPTSTMASALNYDVDEKIVLEALERMALKQASQGRSCRERGRGSNFEVESWRRLRTNWNRSDISAENISQLFQDEKVLDNMLQILEEMYSSAIRLHQSIASRSKPTILKLSKGIASLPNEVLMLIFGFAAPPGGRDSRRQAIWLSHVSRRFRNVALGTQSIWTTLDGYAPEEEFETFLARSGKDSDLHIVLHASLENDDVHNFVDRCLPLASRWATLLVTSGIDESDCDNADGPFEELFECRGEDELRFPRLRLLRVDQFQSVANSGLEPSEDLKFEPRWTFASLQRIECSEYIPLPSSAYTSVKSLSASLSLPISTFPCGFFADLRNLLPTLQSLTVLDLSIRTSTRIMEVFEDCSIECPSLSSLKLDFPSFVFPEAVDSFLEPFMSSLKFPCLTEIAVSLEIYSSKIKLRRIAEARLEELMRCFNFRSFVQLSSITFKLSHTEYKKDPEWCKSAYESWKYPLSYIPQVTSLTLQSFTGIEVGTVQDLRGKSRLQELRLIECNELDVPMLEKLVTSLRKANVWDTLVTFKMENCGSSLEYEDVVKIVGKEKLSFTKSRTNKLVWKLNSEV